MLKPIRQQPGLAHKANGFPWPTRPCQMRLVLRLEKRVDCAGVSQPIVVIDCLVHHCAPIKHDALPTSKHSFLSSGSSRLIWSPSPPSFMLLRQILPTHVSEVSLSSCVLSRHVSKSQMGGAHQDSAVWHVQLAYQREGNNYHTLGPPAIAQSFPAVHRRSHLGVPLRDHHRYAIKRGDRAIAHVVCRSLGPYGAHIFSPRDWGGSDAQNVTDAITLEVTRVVLAVGVFAIGVELPSKYMKKHAKSLLFL